MLTRVVWMVRTVMMITMATGVRKITGKRDKVAGSKAGRMGNARCLGWSYPVATQGVTRLWISRSQGVASPLVSALGHHHPLTGDTRLATSHLHWQPATQEASQAQHLLLNIFPPLALPIGLW